MSRRAQTGFSLIELMIAVVVLATGLLALAALQGAAIRHGADAKARAQAAAIASDVLESIRSTAGFDAAGYRALASQPVRLYTVPGPPGAPPLANAYTVTTQVARFVANPERTAFVPASGEAYDAALLPEYKRVEVSVTWMDSSNNTLQVNMPEVFGNVTRADSIAVSAIPTHTYVAGPRVTPSGR